MQLVYEDGVQIGDLSAYQFKPVETSNRIKENNITSVKNNASIYNQQEAINEDSFSPG